MLLPTKPEIENVLNRRLVLVPYSPDEAARPTDCFNNVSAFSLKAQGCPETGWYYVCETFEDSTVYLREIHHAVWKYPDGRLVDITPYEEGITQPLRDGGLLLFQVDHQALPEILGPNLPLPLPNRYIAMSKNENLSVYLQKRQQMELLKRNADRSFIIQTLRGRGIS